MEPIDSYLLAIGNGFSMDVVKSLGLPSQYMDNLQNEQRKDQYLFLEVTRGSKRVVIATYVTKEEAAIFNITDFKIFVNH